MESIFEAVKNTDSSTRGGGPGFSFSRLRPARRVVASTRESPPPDLLMTVFRRGDRDDQAGGTRRGANMGDPRVTTRTSSTSITCKSQTNRLNNFNSPSRSPEEFMKAVESGEEYSLVNPHSREVTGRSRPARSSSGSSTASWKTASRGDLLGPDQPDNPTRGSVQSNPRSVRRAAVAAVRIVPIWGHQPGEHARDAGRGTRGLTTTS